MRRTVTKQLRACDPQRIATFHLGPRAYDVYDGAARSLERQQGFPTVRDLADLAVYRAEVLSEALEAAEALGL